MLLLRESRVVHTAFFQLILLGCVPATGAQNNSDSRPVNGDRSYNCSLPGLEDFRPGQYEGVFANYLSYLTESSSPMFPVRAKEFEACTGGRIVISEAANIFEDPLADLGTKTRRGSEVFDGYFMSYSHFPEASNLGLAEHLNDRIRRDNAKLKWEDVFPSVQSMGMFNRDGKTFVDFLMYDGDFFVPLVRLDLLERHGFPLPNTWKEVVEIAKFFNNTDLNNDGENDFGFCHFPRIGGGVLDWWWAELIYSTWATTDQLEGSSRGFIFDGNTMEPLLTQGFRSAVEVWKDLWKNGNDSGTDLFKNGRCAIGYSPPGTWKHLLLDPDGVSRHDANGTVVWRPTMASGAYAEPYRFKPFGSTKVFDRSSGKLTACTVDLCPKGETIPKHGHFRDDDRASILPASPLAGQIINRAPFYWSGGLGTMIRKSSPETKKDLLWDFFVYTNSPTTSRHDVASYPSWLDSWRRSHLFPGDNFREAGWSATSIEEHANVMQWALSNEVNGAFNLRIPGLVKYTYEVLGILALSYIDDELTLDDLVQRVYAGWNEITNEAGKLDQLKVYRASLGLEEKSTVDLCRVHRPLMDEKDPSLCRVYDRKETLSPIRLAILLPCLFVTLLLISVAIFFCMRWKQTIADSVWSINPTELIYNDPPETLGQGTFGLVVAAEYRGTTVAVKRVLPPRSSTLQRTGHSITDSEQRIYQFDVERPTDENCEGMKTSSGEDTTSPLYGKLKHDFIAEMRLLSKLRHPSITTVMGAVVRRNTEPLLVMEWMEHGSLHDMLHNQSVPFDGDIILQMLRDVASGMRFLHTAEPPIVHADLKAKNCLVDRSFKVKVADFGMSAKRQAGMAGTPYFMAPELVRGEAAANTKTDCYAFGIVLYEIYSRKNPYAGENFDEVMKAVADPKVRKRPPVPSTCPEKVSTIMNECLDWDPDCRPNFEALDLQLKRSDATSLSPQKKNRRRGFAAQQPSFLEDSYECFPAHVAETLKAGGTVKPVSIPIVTVLLSTVSLPTSYTEDDKVDIVRRLSPKFNKLVKKYELFHVRTVGTSFMVVANLEVKTPSHVQKMAEFAAKLVKKANDTLIDPKDPSKGCIDMIVAFHSGPVVVSVMGSSSPRFCVFGEAVAGCMPLSEHSQKNRIRCSQRAARLLRKQCPEANLIKVSKEEVADDHGGYWVYSGHYAASNEFRFDSLGDTGRV